MNTFVRLSVINQRDVERVREKHKKDRRMGPQGDEESLGSDDSNLWSAFLNFPTVVNLIQLQ